MTTTTKRRAGLWAVFGVLAFLLCGAASCAELPPPTTPTKSTPVMGRVTLSGDSVTLTSLYYAGQDGIPTAAAGWDYSAKIGLGWKAIHAQPRLDQDVAGATTSPDIHVMAFGHNYATGWTQAYENELLIHAVTPAPGSCTVVVKPYYGGTNATHRASIDAYRGWADRLARALPDRVVTVDVTSALTGHLGADGVHLVEGDGITGAAFLAVAQSGVERCAEIS